MRAIALGRKNRVFVTEERGGMSVAIAYTLIETAKIKDADPQAWLTELVPQTYSPQNPL